MRQRVAAVGVMVLLATSAGAQPRPDLSGTWIAAPATGEPAAGRPAAQVFGAQFTIAHQDPAFTLTRTVNGTPTTIKYVLDGPEVTSRRPDVCAKRTRRRCGEGRGMDRP